MAAAGTTLPLEAWSRGNALVLVVAAAAGVIVRDSAPLVLLAVPSFAVLLVLCRGRFTPSGRFGLGNAVTCLRFVLASSIGLVPNSVPTWALGVLLLAIFGLDGLDGWLAGRRGESSPFGAHLDMETDSYLVLLVGLELFTRGRYGAWVLGPGALHFGYVLCLWLFPARNGEIPRFDFGRHAFTGLMLGLVLGMVLGEPFGTVATALGGGLVTVSFAHSFYWSYARRAAG